jgi:hypothetical protein
MTGLRTHATQFILSAAAVAAIRAALMMPRHVSASTDGPWPEPPSCDNNTGTCTSIVDMVAYDCYFEQDYESPFHFCDDPFEASTGDSGPKLVAPLGHPDPAPLKLVAPSGRR